MLRVYKEQQEILDLLEIVDLLDRKEQQEILDLLEIVELMGLPVQLETTDLMGLPVLLGATEQREQLEPILSHQLQQHILQLKQAECR